MNKRIRYMNINENTLGSVRVFETPQGAVLVELNTTENTFSIKNAVTGVVLSTGTNTAGLHALKIKAKNALTKLGVQFDVEPRAKRVKEEEIPVLPNAN